MTTNGLATAEQLMGATAGKRRFKELTLPICGLRVRIRSLTEGEVSRYQGALLSRRGRGIVSGRITEANRRLVVLCLVDAKANRLFKDSDADKLKEWDGADVQFLADECTTFCGLDRDDLEALVGNSDETPAAASPTK